MAQNITLMGASYSAVPAVTLPKTGGGTATFTDVTDTTAAASDVASGKYFYTSAGVKTAGTGSGGGSSVTIKYATTTPLSASSSISFTVDDEPTMFMLFAQASLTTGASPFKVAEVTYDGTNTFGQVITNTNNAQATYDNSSFSYSYNNGTLTVSSSSHNFQAIRYGLFYSVGGSSGNIKTADVQVGSGATSISFTSLEDEPIWFGVAFKSNFSTSSGYQRVIWNVYATEDDSIYGMAMDSQANYSEDYWLYSYNNGSLTITSQGTNDGGYFHQPGYYQLTYVIADASPYEKKSATYRASTSAQTDKIEPSSGYDAMSEVNISIPAVSQTNLTAGNIKSGTTVTISNGQSNLWSVTGTYTGGGGTSKNVQVLQSTSRTNASSLTKVLGDLTVSKTGTYDIYWSGGRTNTSTSYTWGTRLYVDGTGYDTENTTWSNNCQSNHLSNVSLTANQKLSVYARGRTGSYYTFAPMLVIVEA